MTVYANLVDGELKGVYDVIPQVWNGITDFHGRAMADEVFMKENGFVKIVRDTTKFNKETHKMSDFPWYTIENNYVVEHRDILEIPPSEPEPTE